MRYELTDEILKLNTFSNSAEKLNLMNKLLNELSDHFQNKAEKSKKLYELYKYGSIVLVAITTIVASLQVIFPDTFPQWILPIISAGPTVTVAFLGASGVKKIWINSRTTEKHFTTEHFLFNQQAVKYHNISKEEAIRIFSERLVELWNQGHNKWEQNVGDD